MEKLLRYYGAKALRGNRNVGRHYYADRKVYRRVIKPDLQDIKRIDTTPEANYNSNMMNYKSEILKRAQDDTNVSKTHSKELNVLTSYRLNDFKKKAAFTLAEVLITLAIIGIVAAMTIPTLIANYQKKQTVSKLKQTYSVLSQALTMAQAEHGDTTTWEVSGIYGTPTADSDFSSKEALELFVKKYLIPYLKVSKDYGYTTRQAIKYDGSKNPTTGDYTAGAGTRKYFFLLSSNVLVSIVIGTSGCAEGTSVADGTCVDKFLNPNFHVDINGFQGPNTLGKDIFVMRFNLNSRQFEFYKYASSRESALKNCKLYNIYTCGYLIFLDGWEIKEDYPWL